MNGWKKLLSVFFLVTFLFCYASINVFAVTASSAKNTGIISSSGTNTSNKESSRPQTASSSKPASKPLSVSKPASKPAYKTRSSTASSRKVRKKTVAHTSSSSAVSSAVSSQVSSAPESEGISLPEVDSVVENDPLQSAENANTSGMNIRGILSWACIALGVAVVLIVVLSNRRPPRGPRRSRYHRPKRSRKKRLLNDKYYRGLNRF